MVNLTSTTWYIIIGVGAYRNNVGHLIGYSVTIAILAIPQVAIALIGGFLLRYFRHR
jgi:hypothetical protein